MRLALLLFLVASVLVMCACDRAPRSEDTALMPKPIKIGLLVCGDDPHRTTLNVLGVLSERINRSEGVLGRALEIVPIELGCLPKPTKANCVELVSALDPVAVIACASTSTSENTSIDFRECLLESLQKSEIPILLTGDPDSFADARSFDDSPDLPPYAFGVRLPDVQLGRSAACYARTGLGSVRAVGVYQNSDVRSEAHTRSKARVHAFAAAFKESGGAVSIEEHDPFSTDPQKTLEHDPDLLFLALDPEIAVGVMRSFRDAGFTGAFMGDDRWVDSGIAQTGGAVMEGVHFVSRYLRQDPALEELLKDYSQQHGHEPALDEAVCAADALMLVVAVIERFRCFDGPTFVQALAADEEFEMLSGKYGIDPYTRRPAPRQVAVGRVQHAEVVFCEKIRTR